MTRNAVQPFVARARETPSYAGMVFISDDGSRRWITAGEMHERSVQWAHGLRRAGLEVDDVVLEVLPHSSEILEVFWGAMYSGVVPSIFPSPSPRVDRNHFLQQIRGMVEQVEIKAVVTTAEWLQEITGVVEDLNCQVLDVAQVTAGMEEVEFEDEWLEWGPEKGAALQFSSGTTGTKKGVLVRHGMLLQQVDVFREFWNLESSDVVVSWLPLNHDLGLFCGFLIPQVSGIVTVLMSPMHWIRDPKVFLWAVSEYHGTHSSMPNFGFAHLVRSVRESEIAGLDLSSWKQILNGAEPVRAETLADFVERFTPYGLNPHAMMTGYGMSENTAAIALRRFDDEYRVEWIESKALQEESVARTTSAGADGALALVSSGTPVTGTEIEIVDEQGNALPEGGVGEVRYRGLSLFDGYYNRPDLTEEAIRDGWFYSGDIGFFMGGHLFITGRLKDLIIVGGNNIHPEDLEGIADTVDGVFAGKAVAFGVFNERLGTEGAALICELSRKLDDEAREQLVKEVRTRVTRQMDIALADIRLVDRGWVVRSSSGKLARSANREKYLREFAG